jgi:hypothetical protein
LLARIAPATSDAGVLADIEPALLPRLPSQFRDDARFHILRLLEAHPQMTQRQIADALGIADYLREEYETEAVGIAYLGDNAVEVFDRDDDITMSGARIE